MKKFSRVLSMVLALSIAFGLFGFVTVGAEGVVSISSDKTYSRADGQSMKDYLDSLVSAGVIKGYSTDAVFPEGTDYVQFPGGYENGYKQGGGIIFTCKVGGTYDIDLKVKSASETVTKATFYSRAKIDWTSNVTGVSKTENYMRPGDTSELNSTDWTDYGMNVTINGYSAGDKVSVDLYERYGAKPSVGICVKDIVIKEIGNATYSALEAVIDNSKISSGAAAQISVTAMVGSESVNVPSKLLAFESSDTAIATVDATGKVTAKSAGNAEITVKLGNETAGYIVDAVSVTVVDGGFVELPSDFREVVIPETNTIKQNVDNGLIKISNFDEKNITADGAYFIPAGTATDGEGARALSTGAVFEPGYSYKISAKVKSAGADTRVRFSNGSKWNVTDPEKGIEGCKYISIFSNITASEWAVIDYDLDLYGFTSNGTDYVADQSKSTSLFFQENRKNGFDDKTLQGAYIKDISVVKYIRGNVTYSALEAKYNSTEIPVGATVNPEISVMADGQLKNITGNAKLLYESNNPGIISVDKDGNLTAKALGNAVITVKFGTEEAGFITDDVSIAVVETASYSAELYVALDGNDETGDGSKDKPFATIEKARDTIRGYYALPEGGVTVYIRGGIYEISETIEFDERDSGTKESPVVYSAYNNEEVTFIGGKNLNTSAICKVEDEEILNRLSDKNARDHLYMLDLGAQGIEMNDLEAYGWGGNRQNYMPMRIFMNNTLLTEARWPNDDQSQWAIKMKPVDYEGGKYNKANQPAKLSYPDPENRTAKWQTVKSGDAWIGGAIVHFWSSTHLLIDNIDTENKVVTTTGGYTFSLVPGDHYGQRYAIYFANIFEEIDVPGESYVDRENDILYFYPVGSVNDATMMVSTLMKNMIKATNADYITFSGIDFKDTVETPVILNNCDNVRIEYSEISNGSRYGIEMTNCTNTKIYGCHIFSLGNSALKISGGDRVNLIPTGNLIQNNSIHNVAQLPNNRLSRAAVQLNGCVGDVISHNEFTDLNFGALDIGTSNDIVFEYNVIKNVELQTTDAGAIYWGRNVDSLGYVIKYNYFENIGSHRFTHILDGAEGSGAMFTDDGTTCGFVYGNVALDAGSKRGAFASNGGEFNVYQNNIVIFEDTSRSTYALSSKTWGNYEGVSGIKENIPVSSYLYHAKMRDITGGDVNSNGFGADNANGLDIRTRMWSDAWKEHYKGTQWEATLDLYSKDKYEGVKAFYDANNREGLINYMNETFPNELTNKQHNNVALGVANIIGKSNIYDNYLGNDGKVTDAEKAMFVDYEGRNFRLTEEGLAKIRTKAPKFENIPFEEIGLIREDIGHRPSVTINPEVINGVAAEGNTITPSYTFTDADGDMEGKTVVYWYSSNTRNGTYKVIEGKANKYFDVTNDYSGKFLKYEIVPYDNNMLRGETVKSGVIEVRRGGTVNTAKLSATINEAAVIVENAKVGTENGTYPQSAVDSLKAAIEKAKAVAINKDAVQFEIDTATTELADAINLFKLSDNLTLEFMDIGGLVKATDKWFVTKGAPTNDGTKITLKSGDQITYTGEKFLNEIFTFKMKLVPDSDDYTAINVENANPNIGGVAFKVRRDNEKASDVWGDSGYLIWLKNLVYELQEYNPTKYVNEYKNVIFTEFNKEYEVSLGAYDSEGITRFVLFVDGVKVGDIKYSDKLVGQSGYLTMRGPSSPGVTVEIYGATADTTLLDKSIADAEALLENSKTGEDYGEFSAESKATLQAAIDTAKTFKDDVQIMVDRAVLMLERATLDFEKSANDTAKDAKGEYNINYLLEKADITTASTIKLNLDKEKRTPEIIVNGNGADFTISGGTSLSGEGWDGTLTSPEISISASGSLPGGITVSKVYKISSSVVKADAPVRYLLSGEGSKRVYYKDENGKYIEVKQKLNQDSLTEAKKYETSKIKVGNDLVVYVGFLTELVTFSAGVSDEEQTDTPVEPSTPSGGSGGGASSGGNKVGYDATGDDETKQPSATPSEPENFVFDDVKEHWAKDDIMAMYKEGIVSGMSEKAFEPDRSITRAEFATLIAKALKLEAGKADFYDVNDEWFASFVGAAATAGIIAGSDGKFRPNDTITRQEMAIIVVKAYEYLEKTADEAELTFVDNDAIADWATEYVKKAVGAGLISGMGDDMFVPEGDATRAQAASIISRILK